MWICKNNSFVSIVEDRGDPNWVWVRGRRLQDVAAFIESEVGISQDLDADYHFRIKITKLELAQILVGSVMDITYDNFKNSVKDGDLKYFYHEVWGAGQRNLNPHWNS